MGPIDFWSSVPKKGVFVLKSVKLWSFVGALLAIFFGPCLGESRADFIALSFTEGAGTTGTANPNGTGQMVGWDFNIGATINVTYLAAYYGGSTSNTIPSGGVQVGLWNSTGTLLASTTVLQTSSAAPPGVSSGSPFLYAAPIHGTVQLGPGAYVVGELIAPGMHFQQSIPASSVTLGSGLSSLEAVSMGSSTLADPGTNEAGQDNDGRFGPSFAYETVAPEPASFTLLGIGLAGFGCYSWLRKKRLAA